MECFRKELREVRGYKSGAKWRSIRRTLWECPSQTWIDHSISMCGPQPRNLKKKKRKEEKKKISKKKKEKTKKQ